jgi:hypothetical protein
MTLRIVDFSYQGGKLYVVDTQGRLFVQDAPGHEFNGLPQSQRPAFVWREFPTPEGLPITKIATGPAGAMCVLAGSKLYAWQRDSAFNPRVVDPHCWQEMELPNG